MDTCDSKFETVDGDVFACELPVDHDSEDDVIVVHQHGDMRWGE